MTTNATAFFGFLLLLIFILMIAMIIYNATHPADDFVDETVTTTTTTTTTTTDGPAGDQVSTIGRLKRQFDGEQPYVLDPVDGKKWMLNTTDDVYEDADGKWWELI